MHAHGTECGCDVWQAYDQHLNMILGDVEETITSIEIDDETYEEIVKACACPLHWLVYPMCSGKLVLLA